MASSSFSAPGRSSGGDGVLSSVSRSVSRSAIVARDRARAAAAEASTVAKKLLLSTGKAAWIAGTTFLVLVVPLIIEMDREQQLNDLEMQQSALLGAPSAPLPS
ncbi:mitochondrial import receptor subunit TOM9-2-like [Curcuma longa]|uniref:mitochondrial import receptor subunit TOM9-2-like n=1 Tax=Curcuma longa TaxID=136217 RepID=UPI003D9F2A93